MSAHENDLQRREFVLGGLAAVAVGCRTETTAHAPSPPPETPPALSETPIAPPPRAIVRLEAPLKQLTRENHAPGFTAVSLRPGVASMGHVLNIDHFEMSRPIFPPHPHAGFLAITWLMPWSEGAFINRDSLGDRTRIGPGHLHVTVAGSGVVHEEIPEVIGVTGEGLQIFVKLPEADELMAPRAYRVAANDVPVIAHGGGSQTRVLLGEALGVRATPLAPGGTFLGHVSVRGQAVLPVPTGVEAFALVVRGRGQIAGQEAAPHRATSLAAGDTVLTGDDLEVIVGWGEALARRPIFRGPFCMFDAGRLADAGMRFRAGQMGTLTPSPVDWGRG